MLEPGTLLRALPAIETTYDYYRRFYTNGKKHNKKDLLHKGDLILIVDKVSKFENQNIADYYTIWMNGIEARMYATILESQIDHLFEVIE